MMNFPVTLSMMNQLLIAYAEPWFAHSGIQIALILLAGLIAQQVIRFTSQRLHRSVQHQPEGTISGRTARAETLTRVFLTSASAIVWFIAVLMILDKMNVNIVPLLTGAGVLGFAVGFGSQELVKDTIAGFFFLYENQFNVGDFIQIRDKQGQVRDMNLRTVRLKSEDGVTIILRNSQIDMVIKLPKPKPTETTTS